MARKWSIVISESFCVTLSADWLYTITVLTHMIFGWLANASSLGVASAGWAPEWLTWRSSPWSHQLCRLCSSPGRHCQSTMGEYALKSKIRMDKELELWAQRCFELRWLHKPKCLTAGHTDMTSGLLLAWIKIPVYWMDGGINIKSYMAECDSIKCSWAWPLVLPALVRVRRPGTVDVPLSPLCRLLFSTAFMFSCSAASSAYWIPWGWLSCASGGALPNLPLCMWTGAEDKITKAHVRFMGYHAQT